MTQPEKALRIRLKSAAHAVKQPTAPRARCSSLYGRPVVAFVLMTVAAYGLMLAIASISSTSSLTASAQTKAVVELGSPAPDMTFTTVDGAQRRLSEFRGRPVMLWFIATWCPSCKAATRAVAAKFDRLKQSGMQIIQLKLYNNLGYRGPTIEDFAKRYAGSVAPSPDWLWGDASQVGSHTYDPWGYPDVYFLIDKDGILQMADLTPHVTMRKILAFAASVQSSSRRE